MLFAPCSKRTRWTFLNSVNRGWLLGRQRFVYRWTHTVLVPYFGFVYALCRTYENYVEVTLWPTVGKWPHRLLVMVSIYLRLWSLRACSHHAKFCLFCQKICQHEAISSAIDFLHPTKIFASATNLRRCRQLALEAVNILSGEEILCSSTSIRHRVIKSCNISMLWYRDRTNITP